jgi:RND family efflux transporter MFP subunit
VRSDKKTGSIIAGILIALASLAIGWSARAFVFPSAAAESGADEEDAAPSIAPAQMSVRVTTAKVTRGDLPIVVVAAGIVAAAPDAERTLSSRASGRVEQVLAREGETVERGRVLVTFESGPLEAGLAQARAVLAQADSQLAEFDKTGRDRRTAELEAEAARAKSARGLADAQLARLEGLQVDGLVSDKALADAKQSAEQARVDERLASAAASGFETTNAQLQHANLEAARAAAEANVRDAERVVSEAQVRAPADGRITDITARAGEKLDAGATLGRMLVTDARIVRFSVAAAAALGVVVGARATWDDANGAERSGHVVRTGDEVDTASGLVDAFVEPETGAPTLTPGVTVRGELEVRRFENVLLVPERAVVRSEDKQTVVLATADGSARIVEVKVLGRHGGVAAVEGGVQPGERVILDGAYNLPDGAHVVDAATQPARDEK